MTPLAPSLERSRAITPQPGRAATVPSAELTFHDKVAALLTAVHQNGLALKDASPELQNNPDIVLAAVQQNGLAIQFASEDLKNNPDIVLASVQQAGISLFYASPELKNTPEIVLAAVQKYGRALNHASLELKNTPHIVLAAVHQDGYALLFASPELKNNPEIVLAAVKKCGYALEVASDDLKNTPEIVLAAVQQNGMVLQLASRELQNNHDIVLAAVQQNGMVLQLASQELQNNHDIVLAAVQKNGGALEHASDDLKNNPDIVLAAIEEHSGAFQYASPELQNDPTFLLTAAENNGSLLAYIRADLITLHIACAAAAQNPDAIRWVPENYIRDASSNKDDPSIFPLLNPKEKTLDRATRAIEFNPLLVGAIPSEVQINLDEGVVASAIRRNPKALNLMKPECIKPLIVDGLVLNSDASYNTCEQDIIDRNLDRENALRKVAQLVIDKEISEAVASDCIYALAKYFNDDKKFMIYAIAKYGVSLEQASDRLREDPDVVEAARKKDLSLTAYSTSILTSGMFAIQSDLFD